MGEKIQTEISNYCEICPIHNKCIEDECVLFRIEKIIVNKKKGKLNGS